MSRENADKPWDERSVARLRALWAQGLSTAAIGRELDRSKNSVVGKVGRLELPRRASPIRRSGAPKPAPAPRVKPAVPALAELLDAGGKASERAVAVAPLSVAERFPMPERGAVRGCSWPMGEPRSAGFRFCEAPSAAGRSYCPEHCGRAYVARVYRSAEEAAAELVQALRVRADKAGQRGRLAVGPGVG